MTEDEGILARAREAVKDDKRDSWLWRAARQLLDSKEEFTSAERDANKQYDNARLMLMGKRFTPRQAADLKYLIDVATRS